MLLKKISRKKDFIIYLILAEIFLSNLLFCSSSFFSDNNISSSNQENFFKNSSTSKELWVNIWNNSHDNCFHDVAIDSKENIYVAGYIINKINGSNDFLIAAYSNTGALIWNDTWGGQDLERAEGIAIDSNSNIYVVGYAHNWIANQSRVVVLKYNQSGDLMWERILYYGVANGSRGLGINIDEENNIYVCGYVYEYILMLGYFTKPIVIKLNPSGLVLWTAIGGGAFDCGVAEDVVLDSLGNIYIVGYGPDHNMILVKFNPSGVKQWCKTWNGLGESVWGCSIVYDRTFDVLYSAGYSKNRGAYLVKYSLDGMVLSEKVEFGGVINENHVLDPYRLNPTVEMNIALKEKGNVVIPSFSGIYGDTDNDLALFTLDNSLGSERKYEWGEDMADYGFGACCLSEEIIIIVGKTYRYGNGSANGFVLAERNSNTENKDEKQDKHALDNSIYLVPALFITFIISINISLYFREYILNKKQTISNLNSSKEANNLKNLNHCPEKAEGPIRIPYRKNSFEYFKMVFDITHNRKWKSPKQKAKTFLKWIQDNNYRIEW